MTRRAKRAGFEDEVGLEFKPEAKVKVLDFRGSSFSRVSFSAAAVDFRGSSFLGPDWDLDLGPPPAFAKFGAPC